MPLKVPKFKSSATKRILKGTAIAGAVGVGAAALTGVLPGFQNVPNAAGNLLSGALNAGTSAFQGVGDLFNYLPIIAGGGAVLGVLLLLRR